MNYLTLQLKYKLLEGLILILKGPRPSKSLPNRAYDYESSSFGIMLMRENDILFHCVHWL